MFLCSFSLFRSYLSSLLWSVCLSEFQPSPSYPPACSTDVWCWPTLSEGKNWWRQREDGRPSHLPPPRLVSQSAVFKVNIFTPPLIARTSATPSPPNLNTASSNIHPPSSLLRLPVCLTPTACHSQLCHSHSCCWHFTSPSLSSHIPLCPYARGETCTPQQQQQHMWVVYGSHFSCGESDTRSRVWLVFYWD